MRRTPLKRKTPLKSTKRVKARGPVKGRWAEWRAQERAAVMLRAGRRCEACQRPLAGSGQQLEWAHMFGRGHLISEPMASSRHCTMGLCHYCHDIVDGRQPMLDQANEGRLLEELRWTAIRRLIVYLNEEGVDVKAINTEGLDPLGVARMIERQWRDRFL